MSARLLFILLLFITPAWGGQSSDLFDSPKQEEETLVVKVSSTDIIVLENGSKIKLLGIESYGPPRRKYVKLDQKGRPIEEPVEPTIPLEEQALVFAQNLMEGKKVTLEYDIESRDERGHKIAYVHLPDGVIANIELLRQGFVRMRIRPPNLKYEDSFKSAYQEARKEQRGFLSY